MSAAAQWYPELRAELIGHRGLAAAERRRALARLTDGWLTELARGAGLNVAGLALIAVGGYGRAELSPYSDLDLVLLHSADTPDGYTHMAAERLWYPIWDAGVRLDHAVRSAGQARQLARTDMRVLLGLLDLRHLAGDVELSAGLRRQVLTDWRADAATRLPELRSWTADRHQRAGDLANLIVGDLKESRGGLRDLTVMRAVAASWLADCPHQGLDAARDGLLEVRDALHLSAGRATDRLQVQDQDAIAQALGMANRDTLLRTVSGIARTISHAGDLTWHRVAQALQAPAGGPQVRRPLADGVVEQRGEVMLARAADPARDPGLLVRAAAAAARSGLALPPATTARLAGCPVPATPWPAAVLGDFVALLGAGAPLVGVWEALDQAGLITRLLPGWQRLQCLPQRDPVHRFTVDRHLVQTCVEAARLVRRVDRPDLLLLAGLLHDIGKGTGRDHSQAGAETAEAWLTAMGLDERDRAMVVLLVRHHLLLAHTATRRDPDDPATTALVGRIVGDQGTLDLLAALTEADAIAAGPAAWTDWKAHQVAVLVARVHVLLGGTPLGEPEPSALERELLDGAGVLVRVGPGPAGQHVGVAAPDRPGLLATVAGVLTLHRLTVQAARARTVGGRAVQTWAVQPEFGDPPEAAPLRADLLRALDGAPDMAARLARLAQQAARAATPSGRRPDAPLPVVRPAPGASALATVLEVRAADTPGLLYTVTTALAAARTTVTAALVHTRGGDAVDVFYLRDADGSVMTPPRAATVAVQVEQALRAAVSPGRPRTVWHPQSDFSR